MGPWTYILSNLVKYNIHLISRPVSAATASGSSQDFLQKQENLLNKVFLKMSKLLNMKVPSPGESISEVELIEWLVSSGDYVEKDQSIAEVDSDKATLELPAEESGVINILVNEGEIVNVGQVVCTIDTSVKKEREKMWYFRKK